MSIRDRMVAVEDVPHLVGMEDQQDVASTIRRMERERNWDGEGGRAITRTACENALRFMADLWRADPDVPRPSVSPAPDGTISLQWRRDGAGLVVDIAARPRHSATCLAGGRGTKPRRETLPWSEVIERVRQFVSAH